MFIDDKTEQLRAIKRARNVGYFLRTPGFHNTWEMPTTKQAMLGVISSADQGEFALMLHEPSGDLILMQGDGPEH